MFEKFYTFAYEEPVKYGFLVIAFAGIRLGNFDSLSPVSFIIKSKYISDMFASQTRYAASRHDMCARGHSLPCHTNRFFSHHSFHEPIIRARKYSYRFLKRIKETGEWLSKILLTNRPQNKSRVAHTCRTTRKHTYEITQSHHRGDQGIASPSQRAREVKPLERPPLPKPCIRFRWRDRYR